MNATDRISTIPAKELKQPVSIKVASLHSRARGFIMKFKATALYMFVFVGVVMWVHEKAVLEDKAVAANRSEIANAAASVKAITSNKDTARVLLCTGMHIDMWGATMEEFTGIPSSKAVGSTLYEVMNLPKDSPYIDVVKDDAHSFALQGVTIGKAQLDVHYLPGNPGTLLAIPTKDITRIDVEAAAESITILEQVQTTLPAPLVRDEEVITNLRQEIFSKSMRVKGSSKTLDVESETELRDTIYKEISVAPTKTFSK